MMTDDIVTRLRGSADCVCLFHVEHGLTRKCLYCEAADEIERLRTLLDDVLERENKDNVKQLEIVRKVEADRNMWRDALLHGVANLDNLCKGCEICEFIKSEHGKVGGM